MVNDLIIRDATLDDAEAAAELHVKTWQCAYRGQIPDDYLDNLNVLSRTKQWEKKLSNPKLKSRYLIAELHERIVGFCDVGICSESDGNEDMGEIYGIYVEPNYMGQGIGTSLLQKGEEILREFGLSSAILWVLESNDKGRHFYEMNGWKLDGNTRSEEVNNFLFKEVRYHIQLS